MTSDPKSGKRIVDHDAIVAFMLNQDECAACGGRASNAHHVVQKGAPHLGDDVSGNLVALCGTGTMRCHGAMHGNPYTVQVGNWVLDVERRDQEWVASAIGTHIGLYRPDVVSYVLYKLGDSAGREYLYNTYHLVV